MILFTKFIVMFHINLLHVDQKSCFVFNVIINFIYAVCEILKVRVFCPVTLIFDLINKNGKLKEEPDFLLHLLKII
jgi:hypothetical protein